jgi:hypothetical protein
MLTQIHTGFSTLFKHAYHPFYVLIEMIKCGIFDLIGLSVWDEDGWDLK